MGVISAGRDVGRIGNPSYENPWLAVALAPASGSAGPPARTGQRATARGLADALRCRVAASRRAVRAKRHRIRRVELDRNHSRDRSQPKGPVGSGGGVTTAVTAIVLCDMLFVVDDSVAVVAADADGA